MTEKDITSALEKLDGEYEKTNRTYTDAMQAKAKETRTTLDGLVQQANGLADAPDGNDKKQMQSLASQWKSTEITSDNLSDAITASTELKNLISKVDKAKKDADAKKKAEEEAKAKAEAERQAQAQQEQQQAQQPQQNPYGNMYYWGGGYGSTVDQPVVRPVDPPATVGEGYPRHRSRRRHPRATVAATSAEKTGSEADQPRLSR